MSSYRALRAAIRHLAGNGSMQSNAFSVGMGGDADYDVGGALRRIAANINEKYPRRRVGYTEPGTNYFLGPVTTTTSTGVVYTPDAPPPAPRRRGTRPRRTAKQAAPAPAPKPDLVNTGPKKSPFIDWLNDKLPQEFIQCDDCSTFVWLGDEVYIERSDIRVCEPCCERAYTECEDCNNMFYRENGLRVAGGYIVCESCTHNYGECYECSNYVPHDDLYFRNGNYYCESCDPGESDEDDEEEDYSGPRVASGYIHSHSQCVIRYYKCPPFLQLPQEATDRFGNGKSKLPTLWMGFELEVLIRPNISGSDARNSVGATIDGRAILKSDGSLDEPGFELVSLPATLAYHQTKWDDTLRVLQQKTYGWDAKCCGFHVHLNREALTPAQIGKMLVFVNGDGKTVNNRGFIERVAGRNSAAYSEFIKKRLTFGLPSQYRYYRDGVMGANNKLSSLLDKNVYRHLGTTNSGASDGNGRYQAINVEPANTIEIRIFQSNIARLGFLKNIEFCDAMARFCADASMQQMRMDHFISWVDEHRGVYPSLTAWLVREGLLKLRHKPNPNVPAQPFADLR